MLHRILSERTLLDADADFTAKYMAVSHLRTLAAGASGGLTSDSLTALERVLRDGRVRGQTQAYFLYREAAGAFIDVITAGNGLSRAAYDLLTRLLRSADGFCHRAVSESLGGLPLRIRGPHLAVPQSRPIPRMRFKALWEQIPHAPHEPARAVGRTLVIPVDESDHVLAVKTLPEKDSPSGLVQEAAWMAHLRSRNESEMKAFHIPDPILLEGCFLVRLCEWPTSLSHDLGIGPECHAICFRTCLAYYRYPNGSEDQVPVSTEAFCDIMGRAAWLLGRLAAGGIIHQALIPLFHNRIQRHRRNDGGRYLWPRAGRLDRWLASCAYPNIGPTGIRDFEHLLSFKGSERQLYEHIGAHILSLLLVASSYFRNKDPSRVGLDPRGRPVDARDLFEPHVLEDLIRTIFVHYYEGFVGTPPTGPLPVSAADLSGRMIEEMGVDRYMDEIFRASDQREMSDDQFREFLINRGYGPEKAAGVKKGEADILLLTGPHLGQFNNRISLPELIHAVETLSASCIAGRYWNMRREKTG